ncbi:hypothetical protein JW998_12470 [candidate division KSB1 bacterium]|nr:hypothetical protein [candidate division KSB1 bacterium]
MQKLAALTTCAGVGCLFYFRYVINPVLYFTAQEPVFFFDRYFFREFLQYPGGMLEYVSALLAQFTYTPWAGAAMISVIFMLLFVLLRQVMKKTIQFDPSALALVPLMFVLLAHNDYTHSLVVDLVLLVALLFAAIYMSAQRRVVRILFLLILGPLLYYATGAAFLLFGLFAVLFELLHKRDFLLAILIILVSISIPYISASRLFMVRLHDAFWQPAFPDSHSAIIILIYLSAPVFSLLLLLTARLKPAILSPTKPIWIFQSMLVLTLFFTIPLLSLKKIEKSYWQITCYGRSGEWHKLLVQCEKPYPNTPQIVSLINRALGHTGQLGNRLFSYPQDFGLEGLFPADDATISTPLIRSDIYFDLGHYNEAKHWAHEAVSVIGETAWNLQRLAIIYLLYGQLDAARPYLTKLKKTLPLRRWAQQYEHYLHNSEEIKNDPAIAPLLKNVVSENFLSFVNNPLPDLPRLLQANPQNKMAHDYLMAALLLTKKLSRFVRLVDLTQPLPRHYQEAVLIYTSQVQDHGLTIDEKNFSPETLQRFRAFHAAMASNRANKEKAQREVARNFGDTFWCYMVIHIGQGLQGAGGG